ncbi:MAG: hypothetical protein Q9201_002757 [Fulgogasparrea decipioides]
MSAATVPAEQVKAAGSSNTSSPDLSSPPSPRSPKTAQAVAYPHLPSHFQNGVADTGTVADETAAKAVVPKQRRPRKKKEPAEGSIDNKSSTHINGQKAPPRARKPRTPRGVGSSTVIKKEQELAFAPTSDPAKPIAVGLNAITDLQRSPHPYQNSGVPAAPSPQPQNGKLDEAIPTSRNSTHYAFPSPPRPASGQIYDPIRSATIEPRSMHQQQQQYHSHQAPLHARTSASTPPRPVGHASISPSIASLLEPQSAAPACDTIPKRENEYHAVSPPEAKRPRLTPPETAVERTQSVPKELPTAMPHPLPTNNTTSSAMDIDVNPTATKSSGKVNAGTKKPSGQSSSSHSPKPAGRKEAAIPPLPPGNGLLSSAMLGGGYDSKAPERTAPTIILHVPLNGEINKYVNFARLAEEHYGFDALHPRLAAQRERLARVAAAGAVLENAHKAGSGKSTDEMSVDLSEGEPEGDNSNVEMGGVDGAGGVKQSEAEGSELPGVKKRRKRTMKEDMYDKDDPFVDDSEMAFEEQAAATKDGFFVYSGPLVPEGEKAVVERADGAPRGRGRGRGRGSRGGATGGTTRGAAAAATGTSTTLTKSGQPRKKRITKAEKAEMEQEKVQRESMAPLAAKPTNYP